MAATEPIETLPPVREMSTAEAWDEFDQQARYWLGISGEEFLHRWDAGAYQGIVDDAEHPFVMSMAMLIPLVRP
jgi:hypothetical protein